MSYLFHNLFHNIYFTLLKSILFYYVNTSHCSLDGIVHSKRKTKFSIRKQSFIAWHEHCVKILPHIWHIYRAMLSVITIPYFIPYGFLKGLNSKFICVNYFNCNVNITSDQKHIDSSKHSNHSAIKCIFECSVLMQSI